MSTEKRLVLFLLLSVAMMWGMNRLMDRMGWLPKPAPKVAAKNGVGKEQDAPGAQAALKDAPGKASEAAPADPVADASKPANAAAAVPEVAIASAQELVLGSLGKDSPYQMQIRFQQKGAGVLGIQSSQFEAEIAEGQARGRPLSLIAEPGKGAARSRPPSLSLNLAQRDDATPPPAEPPADGAGEVPPEAIESALAPLDGLNWEVVRDEVGQAVRPVTKTLLPGKTEVTGQELAFRTTVAGKQGPLVVTKRFRLWPGESALDFDLRVESPDAEQKVAYELLGPHGLPIEGEWYTGTFRDIFFGGATPGGDQIITRSAYDVVKNQATPERFTSLPMKYAGVENQYFALFVQPVPLPSTLDRSWIEQTTGVVVESAGDDWQKADVTIALQSRAFEVGPNRPLNHAYRLFAGPKNAELLARYDAFELSAYRKGWSLPLIGDMGARFMSKYFISPMLTRTYQVTEWIAGQFGGTRGSYGVAIILLTAIVRLILLPLGLKQARAAKKMQDLQPLLMELKAKYGEDKEKLTRETFALYKKHGVNPMGGCLPALVQLPVLIGLWQALNNSVALRHAPFLWIDNLAAPDMLFKFPFNIPLVGQWLGPYFNVLPIVVVVLMLVQMKLFSPPPTTPEAETQQKTMKYMMVFMAFMFYKVPSGLGIYFITSSLWQICERLLLPSTNPSKRPVIAAGGGAVIETTAREVSRSATGDGDSANVPAARPTGWLAGVRERAQQRIEQIMDEAAKDRTVRNSPAPGDPRPPRDGGPDRNRDGRNRDNRNRPRRGR